MVEVVIILLGVSVILFLGFFAEFIFKKLHIPDILFLLIIGFIIGPFCLKFVEPEMVKGYMPVFTTFALLFLLYDGAFNISLKSLAKGAVESLKITMFNFFISVIVVTGIMFAFSFSITVSLLTGFILGGISSAFVIPLLKQLKVKGETYSVLTLESAITDVLCIVAAFTVMEIITLKMFDFQTMISKIASLFAVAGLVGIIAGIIWIIIVIKIFKENKSYMITIAYLILVYVIAEFLNGNGAIAALFFGLVLKNSKEIIEIFQNITKGQPAKQDEKGKQNHLNGISVTSESEQFFYSQISFFLKTFFFVYIGILFDISDISIIIIGGIIAIGLLASRKLSYFITKEFTPGNKKLIMSTFARGLAAAAIAQAVLINNIEGSAAIANVVYAVIVFTIILSSINIFFIQKSVAEDNKEPE